jgi:hypothetical protein
MIYPTEIEALRAALLDAFDRQRQVDIAARLVARLSQFANRFPLQSGLQASGTLTSSQHSFRFPILWMRTISGDPVGAFKPVEITIPPGGIVISTSPRIATGMPENLCIRKMGKSIEHGWAPVPCGSECRGRTSASRSSAYAGTRGPGCWAAHVSACGAPVPLELAGLTDHTAPCLSE